MQHAIEQAYKSDVVLVALLKKLLPDQIESKISGYLENSENSAEVTEAKRKIREYLSTIYPNSTPKVEK